MRVSCVRVVQVRSWYFEVWNEPNLDFWTGTQADYFKLYSYTARAIKQIDSRLRVGGPATAQSQWIPAFKSFVLANNRTRRPHTSRHTTHGTRHTAHDTITD
jgi:xylan 1,4-beta-xylosidase